MIAPLFTRGKDRHRETSQSTTHILYLQLPFHVLAKITLLANSKYIKPFQVEDQFWSVSSPSFPLSGFQAPGLMQHHDTCRRHLVPCCHHLYYTGFC